MAFQIFSGHLTTTFQPTDPFVMVGDNIVFDMALNVADTILPTPTAEVQWHPEFTSGDPNATTTVWYRETSEEDIGNGDVRMNKVVRRFAEQGSDTPLVAGPHSLDAQFSRKHDFCRLQLRVSTGSGNNCTARVLAVLGAAALSAPP
jgi:hypothetical protein